MLRGSGAGGARPQRGAQADEKPPLLPGATLLTHREKNCRPFHVIASNNDVIACRRDVHSTAQAPGESRRRCPGCPVVCGGLRDPWGRTAPADWSRASPLSLGIVGALSSADTVPHGSGIGAGFGCSGWKARAACHPCDHRGEVGTGLAYACSLRSS